jgi:hypothetical protein
MIVVSILIAIFDIVYLTIVFGADEDEEKRTRVEKTFRSIPMIIVFSLLTTLMIMLFGILFYRWLKRRTNVEEYEVSRSAEGRGDVAMSPNGAHLGDPYYLASPPSTRDVSEEKIFLSLPRVYGRENQPKTNMKTVMGRVARRIPMTVVDSPVLTPQ